MKVAVYHNLGSGGAIRVLEAYLRYYHAQHDFELFLPSTASDKFVSIGKYCTEVHHIPFPESSGKLGPYRHRKNLKRLGRETARKIDAGGFDVALVSASHLGCSGEVLPYLKTPSLYYAPEHFRAVYDSPPGTPEPRSLKSRAADVVYGPTRRWLIRFDRRAFRAATMVFTHSKFESRIIKRMYGIDSRVVYLGVDSEQYRPMNLKRKNVVLSVGGLSPLKGHQFVIEAVGELPEQHRPEVQVIGDRGNYEPELTSLASERDVRLNIRKGIPFRTVVRAYNQATVLAAAQYNEPFGLITLEAMACQTPVVAVKEGGLAETVTDGKTGLLVPRDPSRFANALKKVLTNPKLAKRLGANGRKDVETRWQWSQTADKIDRLLRQVAKS